MIICKTCNQPKSENDFYPYRKTRCKQCELVKSNQYKRNNWEKTQEYERKRGRKKNLKLFGLTLESYELMVQKQNGVCAICKQPETQIMKNGEIRRLAVDHCHKTNKVRGLLCGNCNVAIGHFRDDPSILEEAIFYLQKHQNSL